MTRIAAVRIVDYYRRNPPGAAFPLRSFRVRIRASCQTEFISIVIIITIIRAAAEKIVEAGFSLFKHALPC